MVENGERRGRGKGRGKMAATEDDSDISQNNPLSSSESGSEVGIPSVASSSRGRRRQLPARYRLDEDSDGNDGVLCEICSCNESEGLSSSTIFWIDCDKCCSWVHNICAFGNNTVSK